MSCKASGSTLNIESHWPSLLLRRNGQVRPEGRAIQVQYFLFEEPETDGKGQSDAEPLDLAGEMRSEYIKGTQIIPAEQRKSEYRFISSFTLPTARGSDA